MIKSGNLCVIIFRFISALLLYLFEREAGDWFSESLISVMSFLYHFQIEKIHCLYFMKLIESFAYCAHPSFPPPWSPIYFYHSRLCVVFLPGSCLSPLLASLCLFDIVCGLERNVCLSSMYFKKSSLLRISPPQTQKIRTD